MMYPLKNTANPVSSHRTMAQGVCQLGSLSSFFSVFTIFIFQFFFSWPLTIFFSWNLYQVVVSRGSNWKIIFQFPMCLCLSGIERIFTFSGATMVDNLKSTGLLPIATERKFGKDLKKKLKERSKKFMVVFNGKSTAL